MIKPFSILDTRSKEWQERKRWWINTYNIQSELGRENTESRARFWEDNTVSIFDATLCEKMYEWFCPKEGRVLDPFAGGSVRGIVATEMGYIYNGIDLSDEQIEANKKQSAKPNWITGDSEWVIDSIYDKTQDFVFTCPPYYDLEKYTDNPADLSNMEEDEFDKKYYSILNKAARKLKDNRFFAIVVSEVREQSTTGNYKIGKYKGLVWKTIRACEEAGLHFYNDMILFNSQHQASRVVDTYFERNRKVASVHQNILVFVKGNPDLATEVINSGDQFVCIIEGKQYRSFREAAININPNELVASEVERRCRSTKSKYKDWQIIGEETNPTIKYEISGVPFENPKQVADKLGISESDVRNYFESNNPLYRHWKKVNRNDISYDDMFDEQIHSKIELELPIIECEGLQFYSLKEAGEHFNCSDERIRQKLKDDRYTDYIYLY
jgi:DNA modification methylase/predicted transcriptional regulator